LGTRPYAWTCQTPLTRTDKTWATTLALLPTTPQTTRDMRRKTEDDTHEAGVNDTQSPSGARGIPRPPPRHPPAYGGPTRRGTATLRRSIRRGPTQRKADNATGRLQGTDGTHATCRADPPRAREQMRMKRKRHENWGALNARKACKRRRAQQAPRPPCAAEHPRDRTSEAAPRRTWRRDPHSRWRSSIRRDWNTFDETRASRRAWSTTAQSPAAELWRNCRQESSGAHTSRGIAAP